jgi:23S rRNA (uracil1939-C5)-methyltransferase
MKKGDIIPVTIDKLAYGGQGIGRIENQVIFVEGALPGDRVEVRIQKKKKSYLQAKVLKFLEKSTLRQPASCTHFGDCGGCKWQNLIYKEQLRIKREQIIESLKHLSDIHPECIHSTLPSPLLYDYRNKMEFSFTDKRWLIPEELANLNIKKGFALGLHVPGAFDRVMHIDRCWLQDEIMNDILKFSQEYFKNCKLPVFNLKTHLGLLRFLVIRKSFHHKEYMLNIVTFKAAAEELNDYPVQINRAFPQIVSIINTVNPRFAQIAFGEEEHLLFGQPVITEKIADFEFAISANSFFQTNPLQAENLYGIVVSQAGEGNRLIWDFYAGTGTIALFLSKQNKKIIGFELIESAVKDAIRNSHRNGVNNCEFIAGDVRAKAGQFHDKPDVIVCDPPRSGMHKDIVQTIVDVRPKKIIYVSCNPTTMARDIKPLTEYYRVIEIQPVDMFPHTYHIESVVKLELR